MSPYFRGTRSALIRRPSTSGGAASPAAVVWSSVTNMTDGGSGAVSKSGGVTENWDCFAESSQTFTGDGYVEVVIASGKDCQLGLDDDSTNLATLNSSNSYTLAQYGLHVSPGQGKCGVYEDGVLKLAPASGQVYSAGDTLRVERSGNTVTYKRNGVTFYTSLTSASGKTLRPTATCYQTGTCFTSAVVSSS